MSSELSTQDLRRAVDVVGRFVELEGPGDVPLLLFPLLRDLLPCDILSYNEFDLATWSSLRWSATATEPWDERVSEAFDAFAYQHPLIVHYAATGDGRPVRFSDVIEARRLHALDLYQEFFRPLGVDHQMAIRVPYRAGVSAGIALNRRGRDFSDRERELLAVLRPPLARALVRMRARRTTEAVPRPPDGDGHRLTHRERDVLRLAALGRTNEAVGHLLGISPRTVAKHLEHAYRKLGVSCRTEAATMLLRGS